MQQCVVCCLRITIACLLLNCVSGTIVEVTEYSGRTLGPGVSAVVVTQTQRQSEILSGFPDVLGKQSECPGGSIPVPQLLLPGRRIVHHAILVVRRILSQLEQVIEGELR